MSESIETDEGVRADLYETQDGRVRCTACAHTCVVPEGDEGICNVRKNVDGELRLLTYGKVYAAPRGPPGTPDPVEKKPLFHFEPDTRVLSFGGASCNFSCDFCHNNHISFSAPDELELREVTPDEAVKSARRQGCHGVAWTYNEPTIYAEYVRDGAEKAKEAGMYAAMVSNGYFTDEFVDEVFPHIDAVNVDVKGFDGRTHARVAGGIHDNVREGLEMAHESDVHLESTYLVIPGMNDEPDEIREYAEWVASVDTSIPVHFSRFRPAHNMTDRPPTPVETLETAHDVAREAGLEFVYVGNVPGHENNSTYCPDCGALWVKRHGYNTDVRVDLDGTCDCGRSIGDEFETGM